MSHVASIAALLLAPLLMAQAAAPPATVSDPGLLVLAAQPVEFNAEPQTATGTTVLLTQQASIVGAVRVDAPVAGAIAVGNASLALEISPGTELFPVLLHQHREVRLFCRATTEVTALTPLRPPLITRTCLADNNGDRVFDYLAYLQVNVMPTRAVSGAWEIPATPHVSGGAVTIATTPIRAPVPFTPLQQNHIAPVTLELTARVIGDTAIVELRSREGDASALITDQRETTPVANMPRTVTLSGAQVEVQSLAAGALTYRLISGFPTDQPFVIANNTRR
ncbi:MAG: hypothetical protein IPL62_02110 [Caulobacteraceae bacterium]|nr:hypothetical protein [Caulobacteraceae bacterium]